MSSLWHFYTICTLLSWGLWGFFSAFAERRLDTKTVFAWHCIAIAACAIVGVPFVGLQLPLDQIVVSILGGAGYTQGVMWMVDAIAAGGPLGVVVTVASMYPVVIVMLNAIFMHDDPTMKQELGVGVAIISFILFAEPIDDVDSLATESSRLRRFRWLGYCLLALIGYAVWMFASELCVKLHSPSPLPSTASGARLVWQAVGCSLLCMLHRPSLTANNTHYMATNGVWDFPNLHQRLSKGLLIRVDRKASLSLNYADAGSVDKVGVLSALAMGFGMALGSVTFLVAVQVAPSKYLDPVAMISGMYAGISTLLSRIILKQELSYRRYSGILLALTAGILLAC